MERFGDIVGQLLVQPTRSAPSFNAKPVIARPTSDEECRALKEWAESAPVMREPSASPDQLAKHLAFMAAALPSKGTDELTGKMRLAVYSSILAEYSNAALAFMARRACQSLDWFPTPRQCLDIIADYRAPVPDQVTALRLCSDYAEQKFERWVNDLMNGQPIGEVPEQWKRIAVEQGALRRLSDGSFVSRALYHGPFKAWAPVKDAA